MFGLDFSNSYPENSNCFQLFYNIRINSFVFFNQLNFYNGSTHIIIISDFTYNVLSVILFFATLIGRTTEISTGWSTTKTGGLLLR